MFQSTCKECVAAGMDPELATIEHKDAGEHAKAFHKHIIDKHSPAPGAVPGHENPKRTRSPRKKK
jgi:hypothetical protein